MARNETHEQRQSRRRKQALALAAATIGATGTLVAVHIGNRGKDREKPRPPITAPTRPAQGIEALYRAKSDDTITLPAGRFVLPRSVSWKRLKNVTLRGAGLGKTILDGSRCSTPGVFDIRDCSDLVLTGFNVEGGRGEHVSGIYIEGGSGWKVSFLGLNRNGRSGWLSNWCDDFTLTDSEANGNAVEHGFYLSGDTDRATLERLKASGNGKSGLQVNPAEAGDNRAEKILVRQCLFTENQRASTGYELNLGGLGADSLIENCVIHGKKCIAFSDMGVRGAECRGVRLRRNDIRGSERAVELNKGNSADIDSSNQIQGQIRKG
jgi:hypothetical protein